MSTHHEVRPPWILPLSARGRTALERTSAGLAAFLETAQGTDLRDVTTTLVHGRERFEHRLAVVAGDPASAAAGLRQPRTPSIAVGTPRTVFAFTGQGGQYTGMAAGAYAAYPDFRDWLDQADRLLDGVMPFPLLSCLFDPEMADRLARTDVAAPALLAVQLGLVRVLRRYGITPDAVIGHSVGEFAAAAVSGAVSEQDALVLVARRGRLMVERTEPGTMLSVRCRPASAWDLGKVAELVADEPLVAVAAVNSPRDLVLSGDRRRLAQIEELLNGESVRTRRLAVSHAFHSPLLDPMKDDFHREAAAVTWSAPTSAEWFSCAAGPMTEAPSAAYWRDHLVEPVRFWDALSRVCGSSAVLVEIGPHPALVPLAAQLDDPPALVSTLDRERDAAIAVAGAAAEAWCHGVPTDLTGGEPGRRVHLPGYGFDRRIHTSGTEPAARASVRDLLAGIWKDLLAVAPEGDTSFLAAGGDSLALLRLQQRLKAELGTAPGLGDLLDAGTFAAMLGLLPDDMTASPSPAIPRAATPVTTATTYRPSSAQQRMLFVDVLQSDSNQHNVTLSVDIAGRVDPVAMRAAFTDAQRRHAALRTVFHQTGGRFEAEILAEPGAELCLIDTALGSEQGIARPLTTDEDAREWVRELNAPPVRCLAGVPLRGTLVLGQERSLLVLTVHHVVTDATSMGIMLDDLAQDYHRRRAGDGAPARAGRHQFHDVLAELESIERSGTAESSAYWREQLAGAPDLVPLPTDRPRPEVRRGAGAMWGCDLDPGLADKVRALSARLNATPFSTMLAAYAVLLRHHSGAEDMTIATPVTGRSTEAAQRVVGLLLNTLVLRVRLGCGDSFAELTRAVSATVLDGIRHSAFPFDRLVAELNPKRDPSRTPLFSVMFAMPVDFSLPAFDGMPSRPVDLPGIGAKFDLTLYVTPAANGGLHLDLEYDPALFDEATIRQWGADYLRLLESAVDDPDAEPSLTGPTTVAGTMNERERYVAELWSRTLQAAISGPEADFFEIGGHSLQVLTCLVDLQERYPDATVQDFFAYPTVGEFAARLAELEADTPAPAAEVVRPEVLLTGATGFLGVHLLAALLREPGGRVACVVRRDGQVQAMDRLAKAVEYYVPDVLPELSRRVRVIEADLSTISAEELKRATESVGALIHSAAEVRHFGRVDHYSANNVAPTAKLADLALARGWPMAHISTLSAVGPVPEDGPLITLREDDFDRGEIFDSPYARSKFEAEQIVRKAIGNGLDATVHRVGTLVGNTKTGTFLPDPTVNIMYQILRVILGSGLVPSAPGWGMDLTPVDFAADAILALSRNPAHSGRTFHVCNPVSLAPDDLVRILRDLGYGVVPAPPEAVGSWLGRPGADQIDRDAFAFMAQFVKPATTLVEYDAQATARALGELRCPRPDLALLRTVLGHGIETGFFPKSRLWDFVTTNTHNVLGVAQ